MPKKRKPKIKISYTYVPNKEALNRGFEILAEGLKKNYDKIKKEAEKKEKVNKKKLWKK